MGYKKANHIVFTGVTGTTNPAANTTYYFFTRPYTGWRTVFNNCYCVIPYDGTITAAGIMLTGANSSAEDWTWNICKNDTTDYPIDTIGTVDALKNFINTNMNVPVIAGDEISFKTTTPNPWVTPMNCTGCLGYFILTF